MSCKACKHCHCEHVSCWYGCGLSFVWKGSLQRFFEDEFILNNIHSHNLTYISLVHTFFATDKNPSPNRNDFVYPKKLCILWVSATSTVKKQLLTVSITCSESSFWKKSHENPIDSCDWMYARLLIYGNVLLFHNAKETFKEKPTQLQPPSKLKCVKREGKYTHYSRLKWQMRWGWSAL